MRGRIGAMSLVGLSTAHVNSHNCHVSHDVLRFLAQAKRSGLIPFCQDRLLPVLAVVPATAGPLFAADLGSRSGNFKLSTDATELLSPVSTHH